MGEIRHDNPNLTLGDVHKILYTQFPQYEFSIVKKNDQDFTIKKRGQKPLRVIMYHNTKDKTIYTAYQDFAYWYIYVFIPFVWPYIMIMYFLQKRTREAVRRQPLEEEIVRFLRTVNFNHIEIPQKFQYEGWLSRK